MLRLDPLTPEEAPRLQAIRLRALQDAPDAFGSTFDEALTRPPAFWSEQALKLTTFIAVAEGRDVGMVRCRRDEIRLDAAWVGRLRSSKNQSASRDQLRGCA